jgi:Outer membrane cobalamin receptor protein
MTAEDGSFKFENLQAGEYVLSVSFIGYKEQRSELKAGKGSTLNLGDIVLQPEQEALAAAGITERIPLMEVKADKLVMNVSQLPSAQGADALEMLKKAPGIYVDKDGNITLNGQSVAIWIDGRPSNMNGSSLATLLKSTDATTIDKFEIIEHPSAKYDASGTGGIINIKTKRNFMSSKISYQR